MFQKLFSPPFLIMVVTPSLMGWLVVFLIGIVLASAAALRWFARLSPARRRDVIRLVTALRHR